MGRSKENPATLALAFVATFWCILLKRNLRVLSSQGKPVDYNWDHIVFFASFWAEVAGALGDVYHLIFSFCN